MTHRERVLAAIEHRTPDLPPVGFKATDDAIERLYTHFRVEEITELLGVLPVDTCGDFNNVYHGVYPEYLGSAAGGRDLVLYPASYPDGSWDTIYGYKRHWVSVTGGRNDELVLPPPLLSATTIDELAVHPWPAAEWFDFSSVREQCEAAGDYAVIFSVGGIATVGNLIGHERLYVDMYERPEVLLYAFGKLHEFYLDLTERTLSSAGGLIDIVVIHDDFGTQLGPLMSLDHFREFWKPLFRELFTLVHRFGAKTMMHSCGAVFDFIGDFIDMGADIVDPVQTTAEGMDPRLLKRRFGSDICFHGGIDTQQLLVSGSADEIRRHIDDLFDAFGDTGYIIAPAHYIQGDVPPANLIAMFDHLSSVRLS